MVQQPLQEPVKNVLMSSADRHKRREGMGTWHVNGRAEVWERRALGV